MKCMKSVKREASSCKKEAGIRKRKIRLPGLSWIRRLLLYAAALVLAAAAVFTAVQDFLPIAAASVIYALAALTLGFSSCYLYQDIRYGIRGKMIPGIEAHPLGNRLLKDYRYRTVLTTWSGFGVSALFAVYNLTLGIVYRSMWFGTLAAYYILLGMMRFGALRFQRKAAGQQPDIPKVEEGERRIYRECGVLFLLMTFALGGSVVQMVFFGKGKSYSQIHVIAVAAYTFYKVILAVWNLIKAGRLQSPLLLTIRNIGFADALMSLLSLQAAMFLCFGTYDGPDPRLMNSLTGAAVCLVLFAMGIYMLLPKRRRVTAHSRPGM